MADQAFIKLNAFGPEGTGLTRRPPYPKEGLETEPPVHSSHLYVNDEERGIKIGVWECTPHTSKMIPFAVNEFMILLEGSVTMLERDGRATTVRAGEAFVVPKGVVCQWTQSEPVRKFFAIQNSGLAQASHPDERTLSVMKASLGAVERTKDQPAGSGADMPFEAIGIIYSNHEGSYSLSTWNKISKHSQPVMSHSYQMLRVEAGSLTLSDSDGTTETFGERDVALILPDKPVTWKGSDDLCVLSCSIKNDRLVALQGAAE